MNHAIAILAILISLALAGGFVAFHHYKANDCWRKGGVYLTREMLCVRGIEWVR